jgi:hypothetical protein
MVVSCNLLEREGGLSRTNALPLSQSLMAWRRCSKTSVCVCTFLPVCLSVCLSVSGEEKSLITLTPDVQEAERGTSSRWPDPFLPEQGS